MRLNDNGIVGHPHGKHLPNTKLAIYLPFSEQNQFFADILVILSSMEKGFALIKTIKLCKFYAYSKNVDGFFIYHNVLAILRMLISNAATGFSNFQFSSTTGFISPTTPTLAPSTIMLPTRPSMKLG